MTTSLLKDAGPWTTARNTFAIPPRPSFASRRYFPANPSDPRGSAEADESSAVIFPCSSTNTQYPGRIGDAKAFSPGKFGRVVVGAAAVIAVIAVTAVTIIAGPHIIRAIRESSRGILIQRF